jgi:plastocyanin
MRHARRIGLASLLLVLLVTAVVTGAGTTPARAARTKVKHVTIKNFAFTPQTITVKAGTKVTWKNADGVVHHLASTDSMKTTASVTGMFSSGTLSTGRSFSFTYKKKGTYFYECTIHASMASMHGKVIVK